MPALIWPLMAQTPLFPDRLGQFGNVRKNDVHTGIDLYCEVDQPVIAMEDGEVVLVEAFTGEHVVKEEDKSPWWNNTWAVLIEGAHGVLAYCEIRPVVQQGQWVRQGDVIGTVIPVLRKFKGRPMVMLHFERLRHGSRETFWWRRDQPQPDCFIDPTSILREAAGPSFATFEMDTYDGVRFRDANAVVELDPRYVFGAKLTHAS